MESKVKTWKGVCITIATLAALVILELKAIDAGLNGTLFSVVIAAVAGVGGFMFRHIRK